MTLLWSRVEGLGQQGLTELNENERWARSAVRPALASIEDFTKLAAALAAGVEDGTIVLTEAEKQGLFLALQMFEIQADRLKLQLPGPDDRQARGRPRLESQGPLALS